MPLISFDLSFGRRIRVKYPCIALTQEVSEVVVEEEEEEEEEDIFFGMNSRIKRARRKRRRGIKRPWKNKQLF